MINELLTICKIEGITHKHGEIARIEAMNAWISKYISTIEVENNLIKTNFTADEMDFFKTYLTNQISEQILENHATVITTHNKVKVKVLVLNKISPKNEE